MAALAGGSMRVSGSVRRWRPPRRLRWRRRAIAHSLVLTLVAVGAGISCGRAHAQQSPPQVQTLERIEITGSLIKRIEGETALPIVTITAEELARAGITNAEEAVRLITQNQGGLPTSACDQWIHRCGSVCKPAQPGRAAYAGAAQRQTRGPQPLWQYRCRLEHVAIGGGAADRSADRWRFGDLRQRRDRRCDQLHHASRVSGRHGKR